MGEEGSSSSKERRREDLDKSKVSFGFSVDENEEYTVWCDAGLAYDSRESGWQPTKRREVIYCAKNL